MKFHYSIHRYQIVSRLIQQYINLQRLSTKLRRSQLFFFVYVAIRENEGKVKS